GRIVVGEAAHALVPGEQGFQVGHGHVQAKITGCVSITLATLRSAIGALVLSVGRHFDPRNQRCPTIDCR
ncbi:MAG: hypothetical protein ACRD9S_26010, partial [Pyrinomonadaceae bacterium]